VWRPVEEVNSAAGNQILWATNRGMKKGTEELTIGEKKKMKLHPPPIREDYSKSGLRKKAWPNRNVGPKET